MNTDEHPTTGAKDGNIRMQVPRDPMIWAIFPQHVQGQLIEDALATSKFLSQPALTIPEDKQDDVLYLPVDNKLLPLKGWVTYTTRKEVHNTRFLTHDHLLLYLAMMTRNYEAPQWKNSVIVSWAMTARAADCALYYCKYLRQGSLSHEELNIMQDGFKYARECVHQYKDLSKIEFIYYPHNIVGAHYTLLVAVNPMCVYNKHFPPMDDNENAYNHKIFGYFNLDSIGNFNGENTMPSECGFIWFMNYIYSYH